MRCSGLVCACVVVAYGRLACGSVVVDSYGRIGCTAVTHRLHGDHPQGPKRGWIWRDYFVRWRKGKAPKGRSSPKRKRPPPERPVVKTKLQAERLTRKMDKKAVFSPLRFSCPTCGFYTKEEPPRKLGSWSHDVGGGRLLVASLGAVSWRVEVGNFVFQWRRLVGGYLDM